MSEPNMLSQWLGYGRDIAQGASNAAAGTISGPVDALAWALRKAGAGGLLGNGAPVGGSDWMAQHGLTAPPQNQLAGMAGETMGLLSPIGVAAKAPQIARGLLDVGANALAPTSALNAQRGAIVYHGSPHTFDSFDMSKIGTGEGAQVYGHGLYFADSPAVAQSYKDVLTSTAAPGDGVGGAYHFLQRFGGDVDYAKEALRGQIDGMRANYSPNLGQAEATLASLENGSYKTYKPPEGSLYKVDLPDEHIAKMLDWDKPLSPELRTRLSTAMIDDPKIQDGLGAVRDGRDVYEGIARSMQNRGGAGTQADVTAWLKAQGIPGIKYLDGGSRGTGAGTSNYVVFDDALPKIVERNGLLK